MTVINKRLNLMTLILAACLLLLLMLIATISMRNSFVDHEAGLKAAQRNVENVLSTGFEKVRALGVTEAKYREMMLALIGKSTEGTFGKNGTQQAMTWLGQMYPNVDSGVYRELANGVKAAYDDLRNQQEAQLDRVRAYEGALKRFPGNLVAGALGYPTIDLADHEQQIVSTAEAKKAMRTKEMPKLDF